MKNTYTSKYPFADIKVGEKFIINGFSPFRKLKKPFNLHMYKTTIRNQTSLWGKRLNRKFATTSQRGELAIVIKRVK